MKGDTRSLDHGSREVRSVVLHSSVFIVGMPVLRRNSLTYQSG